MKPRLAFIDHSFHRKSQASAFLVDILSHEYEIDIYWDDSWQGGPRTDLKEIVQQDVAAVLFFQILLFPPGELALLRDKTVFLVPMFDGTPLLFDHFWKYYAALPGLRCINFCRFLHLRLTKLGFNSRYFQYFPTIDALDTTSNSTNNTGTKNETNKATRNNPPALKGFFWQRTGRLTWAHIRQLIAQSDFSAITIHLAGDPPGCDYVLPTAAEKKQYHIETSKWFAGKDEYLELVKNANVYFAPRPTEGIGMSFLEAMALGKCVVAPDRPTMNEYIRHGDNGLLYQLKHPQPLDFSDLENICQRAQQFAQEGAEKWLQARTELADFAKPRAVPGPLLASHAVPVAIKLKRNFYFSIKFFLYFLKKTVNTILPGVIRFLRKR